MMRKDAFSAGGRLLVALALLVMVLGMDRARGASAAYVVFDDQTGVVLAEHAMNAKRQVASLTKIATAMVVLDWTEVGGGKLDDVAVVPAGAMPAGSPNPLSLAPGERMSLRDLIYAALLQSDNVAAAVLADHVGRNLQQAAGPGSDLGRMSPEQAFVFQMNELARRLRMTRTHFVNPHGLDSGKQRGYSCAADLGRLTRYAVARAAFRFFVSQVERHIVVNGRGYLLRNTNTLLGREGIDGVKTGTTRLAGDCLIVSSGHSPESYQQGNQVTITPRRVTVVLLGSDDRFGEGLNLVRAGWQLHGEWAGAGRPMDGKRTLADAGQ